MFLRFHPAGRIQLPIRGCTLQFHKPCIQSVLPHQVFMCSAFCHNPSVQNNNLIRIFHRSHSMGNGKNGGLVFPENPLKMQIPSELVPRCPVCGKPMSMNLRCDETFVEDDGWKMAARRYQDFLETHKNALETGKVARMAG